MKQIFIIIIALFAFGQISVQGQGSGMKNQSEGWLQKSSSENGKTRLNGIIGDNNETPTDDPTGAPVSIPPVTCLLVCGFIYALYVNKKKVIIDRNM